MAFTRSTRLPCDYKDGGCDDGRCKLDFCFLAKEEEATIAAAKAAEAERVWPEAERVARELLKRKASVSRPASKSRRWRRSDVLKVAKERLADAEAQAREIRDLIKLANSN